MDNQPLQQTRSKSPFLAAILSAILPGSGFFYLGQALRGFVYLIIFGVLIALEVEASQYMSKTSEIVILGLLIGGFYLFQIIDSFNQAAKQKPFRSAEKSSAPAEEISMFGSILILLLGVVFQLERLDVIDFDSIIKLWPLVLVIIGLKIILFPQKKVEGEEKNEEK